jgi:hypothetical protein
MMMADQECCICLDDIDISSNNYLKTECNHMFHSKCLIMNIATNHFNPFGCPCCRNCLIDNADDTKMQQEESEEDDDEEDDEEEDEEEEEDPDNIRPSAEYITQKLVSCQVTMEDLVKILLRQYDDYDYWQDALLAASVDDKIKNIVASFREEQQQLAQPMQEQQQLAQPMQEQIADLVLPQNITLRRSPRLHSR